MGNISIPHHREEIDMEVHPSIEDLLGRVILLKSINHDPIEADKFTEGLVLT
jgi:hypothetical protein